MEGEKCEGGRAREEAGQGKRNLKPCPLLQLTPILSIDLHIKKIKSYQSRASLLHM